MTLTTTAVLFTDATYIKRIGILNAKNTKVQRTAKRRKAQSAAIQHLMCTKRPFEILSTE